MVREGVKFYRLCKVLFIVSGRAGVMSAQAEDRLGRNRVYGVNRAYGVCAWVRKEQSPLISVFYRLFLFLSVLSRQSRSDERTD